MAKYRKKGTIIEAIFCPKGRVHHSELDNAPECGSWQSAPI